MKLYLDLGFPIGISTENTDLRKLSFALYSKSSNFFEIEFLNLVFGKNSGMRARYVHF